MMNMDRRALLRLLVVASLGLAVGLPLEADAAEKTATVAVEVVRASKAAGPTDPKAEAIRQQMGDFAYKSFRHLATRTASVELKASREVELVEGKKLRVAFRQVDKDGRARLQLAIPGVIDTVVSLAPGGTVVLGGPALPSGDGVLFVPVTLRAVK
jgi:phosphoglycolate phosphatase-like HAD superfamily hydrolase